MPCKTWLFSVHFRTVEYTKCYFLQGTWKTRPRLSGRVLQGVCNIMPFFVSVIFCYLLICCFWDRIFMSRIILNPSNFLSLFCLSNCLSLCMSLFLSESLCLLIFLLSMSMSISLSIVYCLCLWLPPRAVHSCLYSFFVFFKPIQTSFCNYFVVVFHSYKAF